MQLTTLSTGAEIPAPLLSVTILNLHLLSREHSVEFYELVQLARNPDHQLFGQSGEVLRQFGLMDGVNRLQSTIREIVLAAVVGDEFDLRIVNPVLQSHEDDTL